MPFVVFFYVLWCGVFTHLLVCIFSKSFKDHGWQTEYEVEHYHYPKGTFNYKCPFFCFGKLYLLLFAFSDDFIYITLLLIISVGVYVNPQEIYCSLLFGQKSKKVIPKGPIDIHFLYLWIKLNRISFSVIKNTI